MSMMLGQSTEKKEKMVYRTSIFVVGSLDQAILNHPKLSEAPMQGHIFSPGRRHWSINSRKPEIMCGLNLIASDCHNKKSKISCHGFFDSSTMSSKI